MANNPRKLRPIELCRLLNSTPLGEVITEQQLRCHRTRAGLRIGDDRHVDLVRYVGWLLKMRHAPAAVLEDTNADPSDSHVAAEGAAALACERQLQSHGQKFTSKQEALIAALLTEPNYSSAAARAGVSPATVYRWLRMPSFRAAYRLARRELIESAIGRIQAASGQAIDTLVNVARKGRRDSDRVRAAVALLDRSFRCLIDSDVLHGDLDLPASRALETQDVVKLVSARLEQLDQSELSTSDKSRLTATLANALLQAISVDVLDKRLAALQGVLITRKEKKR